MQCSVYISFIYMYLYIPVCQHDGAKISDQNYLKLGMMVLLGTLSNCVDFGLKAQFDGLSHWFSVVRLATDCTFLLLFFNQNIRPTGMRLVRI